MQLLFGIIFLVIGLGVLLHLSVKETDRITHWKMIFSACSGVFCLGGIILIFSLIL